MAVWNLRRACAFAEIALRLEEDPRDQLEGEDPVDAWNELHRIYGSKQAGVGSSLLSQLSTIKYDGVTPILEFKSQVTSLKRQLADAGENISKTQLLTFFLNALGPEYDGFVSTVKVDTDGLDTVVDRLRQLELRKSGRTGDTMAFLAREPPTPPLHSKSLPAGASSGRTPKVTPETTCFRCTGKGHVSSQCPTPRSAPAEGGGSRGGHRGRRPNRGHGRGRGRNSNGNASHSSSGSHISRIGTATGKMFPMIERLYQAVEEDSTVPHLSSRPDPSAPPTPPSMRSAVALSSSLR